MRDRGNVGERTPDKDIEDQDDEADDSTTGAVLRGVGAHGRERLVGDRCGVAQSREAELEEDVEHHGDGYFVKCDLCRVVARVSSVV